ncbi:MAG: inositol monophosphatase family protein [Buchnera aphidicola (Tetraneura akinire)]|nr:inositol monophosphatase family protein [Buchnera sp. (in: enterobacteria)]
MYPMLNIAIRAVRKSGNLLIQKYDLKKNIINLDKKKNDHFIKNVINVVQNKMIEIIQKSYPDHVIDSQYKIHKTFLKKTIVWIINPIDGIDNFKKNLPHFSTSIAIKIKNNTVISAIYDPFKNELFTAINGKGAQLNGYRIRCSEIHSFSISSIAINDNIHKNQKLSFLYLKIINLLILQKVKFRCTGSSTLDLAYIANGRFDFLLHCNFKPYFFLAGQLQLKESGSLICDINGGSNYLQSGIALIGNYKFIRIIQKKIKELL